MRILYAQKIEGIDQIHPFQHRDHETINRKQNLVPQIPSRK